ncbi:MAG: MOSC domain-containing protein [Campylobacterales bacterium]|nr:MOSC domain-containing protein [Campylobacterales bacterium]
MKKRVLGTVVHLYISKEGAKTREKKETLSVELDGPQGDKFKGKDSERSVLLVACYSYELAKQNGIDVSAGELGENILLDFDPYALEPGTQLQIGNVTLEIAQKSSLCNSLSKINSNLPKLLKDKRGMFAKVIHPGFINEGERVYFVV